MNTATNITSISIFGSGGALGAYAQNSLLLVCAFGLALTVALAPFVAHFLTVRFIIRESGSGSEDFKHYCEAMASSGNSPP